MSRLSIKRAAKSSDTMLFVATGIKAPPEKPTTELNTRQKAFIDHYVILKNASEAAKKAGYSAKGLNVAGSTLLANPNIRAEVDRRLGKQAEKLEITAEMVRAEMAKLAFANMQDFMKVGPDGAPVTDFSSLTRDQAAALQSITVEEFTDGRSDKREVRRVKFTLADKAKNLEMLGKHFNMFVEQHKHEHTHSVLGTLLNEIDEESRRPMIDVMPTEVKRDE
jgi:phage terminase small subunit